MAIAFDKNIVWTIDNELELALAQSGKIFPAELSRRTVSFDVAALDRNSLMRKYNSFDYTWRIIWNYVRCHLGYDITVMGSGTSYRSLY